MSKLYILKLNVLEQLKYLLQPHNGKFIQISTSWIIRTPSQPRLTIFLNQFEIKTPYSLQTTVRTDTTIRQNVNPYHTIDLPMFVVIWNGEIQDIPQ